MHKFAKQIMDCVKAHVDGIGIENFDGQNLDDLKDWTEIAKNTSTQEISVANANITVNRIGQEVQYYA